MNQFVKVITDVDAALTTASIPYAFGGALALNCYAEPRATRGIDVNVFASTTYDTVTSVLADIGFRPLVGETVPNAGIRYVDDGPFPIDIFLPIDVEYDEIEARVVSAPLGSGPVLPFLSVEDLVLFKLSFGRDKDWVDIRAVINAGNLLDTAYIERQLLAMRGSTITPRLARLRGLTRGQVSPRSS